MSALGFLLRKKLKNQMRELIRKPAKLIYLIFMVAICIFTLSVGNLNEPSAENFKDMHILTAGIFAFYTLMFVLIARSGFDAGSTIFKMPDVNFLFPSPLSAQNILFYGLFQQLGTSLLLGLFLIFQYTWMHQTFGITYIHLILILLGYAVIMFTAQLTAMVIYCFSSSNEKAGNVLKFLFYGFVVLLVAGAGLAVLQDKSAIVQQLVNYGNGTVSLIFPVSGWIADIVTGLMYGDYTRMVIGSIIFILYIIALMVYFQLSNPDYYEEVLQTSEKTFSSVTAAKEGRAAEVVPKNVKLGVTGFTKGKGASAFYYKHLIENRRSRTFLLSPLQMIFMIATIIFAFSMREVGIIPVLAFATYMQIFSIALGRMTKELSKPFIYLVPEPAFKKLLYSMKESFSGYVVDALIVFIPVGFITGSSVEVIAACVVARISYSIIMTAGNLIIERIFGHGTSKVFTMLFFMLCIIVLALPGAILAIVAAVIGQGIFATVSGILLILTICNVLVSLLAFFLCRNLLEYPELN